MKVRKFKNSDAEAVSQLIIENLQKVSSQYYSPEIIGNLIRENLPEALLEKQKKYQIFVAENNSDLVGTASLWPEKTKEFVIKSVFVKNGLQNHGIGSILIKHLEAEARSQNAAQIFIPSALNALDFYKKLGYQEFKKTKNELAGKIIIVSKTI